VAGWIDWNRNGELSSDERIFLQNKTIGTADTFQFSVPSTVSFSNARYYARFRICPAVQLYDEVEEDYYWVYGDCSTPTATDVVNGEIEDYAWDWGTPPTSAGLAGVSARAHGDAILVTWETSTEIEIVGFDIYRSEAADGEFIKLNDEMIMAEAFLEDPLYGQTYTWLDAGALCGQTYYYYIEVIGPSGASVSSSDPIAATWYCCQIYLPMVLKNP